MTYGQVSQQNIKLPSPKRNGLLRRIYAGGSGSTYRAVSLHRNRRVPAIAHRFTDAIVNHCERFRELPARSVRRDDIRPGLHLTNYRGRVSLLLQLKVRRDDPDATLWFLWFFGRLSFLAFTVPD